MRILFVCTGNVCRSPLAEGLAVHLISRSLGPRATEVEVRSAGVHASVGRPMDPASAAALRRLGGEPPAAPAQALTSVLSAGADLVLTMTRRHRQQVLELFPRGLRQTFTLREAAELLDRCHVTGLADLPLDERARELGLRLDAQRPFRPLQASDDIADPIGREPSVHEQVVDEIAAALRPLAEVLLGVEVPVTHGSPAAAARERG